MHVAEKNWDKVKSNKTLKASISHSLGSEKLAKAAKSMGVNEVLRWKPNNSVSTLGILICLHQHF